MIEISKLCKSFAAKQVIRDATFRLEPGEVAGLVGPSGGGKSVLLKLIGGIISADGGEVKYDHSMGRAAGFTVGFSFQEGALFDSMSVLENVAFPLLSASGRQKERVGYREAMVRASDILQEVGLGRDILKMPGQISGGMRRRVGIARALVGRPDLVLLDDPTGGLDPVAASVIMNLIKKLHSQYLPTIILVSHDIRRLLPNVGKVLALFQGTIAFCGSPESLEKSADPRIVRFLATRFDFSKFSAGS